MSRTSTGILGLVVAATLLLTGCSKADSDRAADGKSATANSSPSAKGADRRAALASMVDEVILPGLEQLVTATGDLAAAAATICPRPGPEQIAQARAAWTRAADAWAATAAFRFGPAPKLRSAAGISYPINAAKIDRMFAADGEFATAAPSVEAVAKLGADKRGLGAIEYLLFAPASDGPALGLVAESAQACAFVASAAQNVLASAVTLRDAWTEGSDKLGHPGPFAQQFTAPGSASMYGNQQEAVNDVVNSLLGALATDGDMVLGQATGRTTPEPAPQAADPGAAQHAQQTTLLSLDSVAELYGAKGERLAAVVSAQSSTTGNDADGRFRGALDAARRALARVKGPIAQLSPQDAARGPMLEAFEQVDKARRILRTEVASQLGVTVVFSDSDGDG